MRHYLPGFLVVIVCGVDRDQGEEQHKQMMRHEEHCVAEHSGLELAANYRHTANYMTSQSASDTGLGCSS